MTSDTPPLNEQMTVLVLDDETPVVHAVRRQLQAMECRVFCASDVPTARALEAQHQIDVALIDHNLAGSTINGLDYLTGLQNRNAYCFRIIFTGQSDFDFAVEAINNGHIDAFLPKPWNEEQLRAIVRQGAQTAWLRQHNSLLHEHLADQNEQLNRFNAQLEELVLERTEKLETANRKLMAANRELKNYQDELVRLETQASITQLAQGLAHELNNPLAVILGYAQRYGRRFENDPQLAKCFTIIREEGERSQQLIAKLRKFAPRQADDLEECRLEVLFNAAAERLLERRDDILPILLHDPDLSIRIGRRSFVQALEHILENAYDNPGTQQIEVSHSLARQRLRIHIDNDGDPTSNEAIQNASKPFFTTRGVNHPGLGFSVAASLLGHMGCTIALDHTPDGRGARVTIVLPPESYMTEDPVPTLNELLEPTPRTVDALPDITPSQAPLLLVIDDEPLVLELVSTTCADADFPCLACEDLATARQLLSEHPIGWLIIDAHLRDGNSDEFIGELIDHYPVVTHHILIITGDPNAGYVQQMVRRYNCQVLGKPFRISDLDAQLQRWR